MSKLDGLDAFEHVVDRLIEEGRARTHDMEARKNAEARAKETEIALADMRGQADAAVKRLRSFEDAMLPLAELYQIVEKIIPIMRTDQGMAYLTDELSTALERAQKHLNPLPF